MMKISSKVLLLRCASIFAEAFQSREVSAGWTKIANVTPSRIFPSRSHRSVLIVRILASTSKSSHSSINNTDAKCSSQNDGKSLRANSSRIVNTLSGNKNGQEIDWNDRIGLQSEWDNPSKGWKVEVEWKQTPFGAGLFAIEDIPANTVLRVGKNGKNLIQFRSVDDIKQFCHGKQLKAGVDDENHDSEENFDENSEEFNARLLYVKDYLWGFNPNTDEQGYDIIRKNKVDGLVDDGVTHRFFGMWVPGNGLNHNLVPNTVYRPSPNGGTNDGIDLISLRDIQKGEELYDDYRRHGTAPPWLVEFSKQYNVSLNFADCNNFVTQSESNLP